jgi:hypothetical protein
MIAPLFAATQGRRPDSSTDGGASSNARPRVKPIKMIRPAQAVLQNPVKIGQLDK